MALPVTSFQDSIKRTASVPESDRPLPPRPLLNRSASDSSNSRSRSRTTSPFTGRRSSSVYSRTVSQWNPDRISWTSADFSDEPLPPLPILRPLAYSASTPQLVEKNADAPILQPRTFSPLIRTPSATTASNIDTPATTQEERDSYFPSRNLPFQPRKKHVLTISLEEAKAAIHAPGAMRLLPEELRARQLRKSRSDEALRNAPLFATAKLVAEMSPQPMTLVDRQGRRRTLLLPRDSFAFVAKHPLALSRGGKATTNAAFQAGDGTQKCNAPSATPYQAAPNNTTVQDPNLDDFDEPRGRTRHRGPRKLNYEHYARNGKQDAEGAAIRDRPDSQTIANEYHALLAEQYSGPSPDYYGIESDDKVKAYMDMIPQPLFHSKPLARVPGQPGRNDEDGLITPYSLDPAISEIGDSLDSERRRRQESIPHSLTIPRTSTHRRSSTSGTIPISPPEPLARSFTVHTSRSRVSDGSPSATSKKNKVDSRVSAYYPHVASRKKRKARKGSNNLSQDSEIPPMPFLFSGTDGNSIESGSYASSPSSFNTMPFAKFAGHGKLRKESDGSSKKCRPRLHERVVKGAMDLVIHHDRLESESYRPTAVATASEGSPHLLPSPAKSDRKEIHLGWSDIAKSTFDKVISPTKAPPKSDSVVSTQVVIPDRTLDETAAGVKELESPRRKNSILGGFLDSWKESKAEKRREELKKMIRFVPYEVEESPVDPGRRNSVLGWM